MLEYSIYVMLIQAEEMMQPLKLKLEKEAIVHLLLLGFAFLNLNFTFFFHITTLHLATLIKDFKFLHSLQTNITACKSTTIVAD